MSETIDQMIGDILDHEGGFVNDPADPGGATNHGISLRFLRSINPRATIDDIKNLTADEAAGMFKRYFYFAPRIDTLQSELQPMMFDECVNFGAKHAIQCLQRAVVCPDDGRIGDGTRQALTEAIARVGIAVVNNKIVDQLVLEYEHIVIANPAEQKFLNGWEARANSWRMNTMLKLRPLSACHATFVAGAHRLGVC